MAQNNKNTNKGRWSGKSENDMRTKKNKMLPILRQKFSSLLDIDIICNVAENHNWEYEPSVRDLIQLTSHSQNQNSHMHRPPPNIPMHIPPPPIPPTFQQPNPFTPQGYTFQYQQPPMPLLNTSRPHFINLGNDPKNTQMYKPNFKINPKAPQGPVKLDVAQGKQNYINQAKPNPGNPSNKSMKKQQPSQENKSKGPASKTVPQQGVNSQFTKIKNHINAGHRIMILMRGCPGSGKTHAARHLISITVKKPFVDHIFSTDDYFERDKKNGYLFVPEQLPKAHDWNLKRVQSVTNKGISPVIVDNTNSEPWEMLPYMKLAVANGYIIELLEIRTKWHRDEVELTRRNIHGVPRHSIHNMLERFKYGLSAGKLFQLYKFSYPSGKQPPISATNFKSTVPVEKKKAKKRPKKNKKLAEKLINADSEDVGKILSGLDSSTVERLKIYLGEIKELKLKEKNDLTDATEATLEANVVAALETNEPKASSSFTSSLQDPDSVDDSSMSDGSSDHQDNDEELLDINNWDVESDCGTDLISLDDEACSREDSWQYLLAKNIDSSSLSQSSTDLLNIEEKTSTTEDWEKWFEDLSLDSEKNSLEQAKNKIDFSEKSNFVIQPSYWGVDNEEDWEISKKEMLSTFSLGPQDQRLPQKNTCDVEVNTNESDSYLANRLDNGLIPEDDLKDIGKILNGINRDIINPSLPINPAPRRSGYFDKSSMTEVIVDVIQGDAGSIELMHMFPTVPRVEIDDLLERCGGDLDWAAKLLLETNTTERIPESSILENPIDIPFEKEDTTPRSEIESMPKHRSFRQKKAVPPSEESLILKKELETNFALNESLYSAGTRKARRLKQGRSLDNEEPSLTINDQIHASSTSSITHLLDEDIPDETVEEEEKSISIKLDSGFVRELQNNFGASIYPIPEGAPEIEIPLSLARQLHYYLMESLQQNWNKQQNALDLMMQEDEALARLLQEAENKNKEAPSLREIMDMELSLAIYKADQEAESGASNQENIATLLNKRMLRESFPMVDPKLLYEVLKAHDNNMRDTVMVIEENLNLSETGTVKQVMSPEALALQEKSLIERAKQESLKLVPEKKPIIVVRENSAGPFIEQNQLTVDNFRKEAANFYERRNEYSAKAKEAFRAKQYSTASYYSTLVEIYRKKIVQVNNQTASSLVATQKPDVTTLDLHHLFVREAIEVLDCFIDRHIQRLKDLNGTSLANKNKTREKIYLITGRGANSRDGKSRIRPAVMARLNQRKLKFTTENPGMLKVILHKDNNMTRNIDE